MPEIVDTCPHCELQIHIASRYVGSELTCPGCENIFMVGSLSVETASEVLTNGATGALEAEGVGRMAPAALDTEDVLARAERFNDEAETRSMLQHIPVAPPTADVAPSSEILRRFLTVNWEDLVRREFFASVPTFVDHIHELGPLLSRASGLRLEKELKTIIQRWKSGKARMKNGQRVFAKDQGVPELASLCIDIANQLLKADEHGFITPLTDVALQAIRITNDKRSSGEFIAAFRLRTLSQLLRRNRVAFDSVIGDVRNAAESLRESSRSKHIAPRPEDLSKAVSDIVYSYYTTLLGRVSTNRDHTGAQDIVPDSLCLVARLLAEEGQWERLARWVALCASLAPDDVDSAREMGVLIEYDPLEAPSKTTQADVMLCLQNRDTEGALRELGPWFDSMHTRLTNTLKAFLECRVPDGAHFTINDALPETRIREDLKKAIAHYHHKNFTAALASLKNVPAVGAVGQHPIVREWRALVQARLGARQQAIDLFRLSIRSTFVLEDTVWNLAVLLESEGTESAQRAAFEALRDYLRQPAIHVFDGVSDSEKSGRHLLSNTANVLTVLSLALSLREERYIVDLIVTTPRSTLRLYGSLLPLAFVLALRSGHESADELRDALISHWAGGRHTEWADPETPLADSDLRNYLSETGGVPAELTRLAEYLERRTKHHKNHPLLYQCLAEVYLALELHEKALEAQIAAVTKLGRFQALENELQQAFDTAISIAQEYSLEKKLQPLLTWAVKAGKGHWLAKSGISAALNESHSVVTHEPPAAPLMQETVTKQPKTSRLTLATAISGAQSDAEVLVELVSEGIANDANEADLVFRIVNHRIVPLTDVELHLEFDSPEVHAGSAYAAVVGPHALRDRAANATSYETVAVNCPVTVSIVTVSVALVYTIEGQRRYREAARPRLSCRPFSELTGSHEGIPYDLYYYGGMVSGAHSHTFKGRDKLRDTLLDRTVNGNMTHFLDGIKRVGKSSVCANLVYDSSSAIIAIHLDLERYALGDERTTTTSFSRHLLADIKLGVTARGHTLPDPVTEDRWDHEPATIVFMDALRALAAAIRPARLLLMFDEVQALLASVEHNQRGRDSNKYVRKDFLDMLSAMLNDAGRPVQLLFTASERFETIKSGGFYNLFNRLSPINLGFLDAAATGEILSAGVHNTEIRYTPEAVSAVWQYLRGYPAHVQQMGDKLMEKLRQRHRTLVLPQDVSEVAELMINDSVLFDYQCNRDTIGRDEATLLEAIFKGQEQLAGKRLSVGRGVPVRSIVNFATGLESARIPVVIKALKNNQVISEERDSEGQLMVRINGLLMELWLSRLREERSVLREEAFPSKRPSLLVASQEAPVTRTASDRTGCAVWVDFENVARAETLANKFLGNVDCVSAARDFVLRLQAACASAGLDLRDKRVVAPWSIDELQAYQDAFEVLGFKPVNCMRGVKNAADFVIAQELAEKLPLYAVSGIGTILLITADNDLATAITRAKGGGMTTAAWGVWNRRASRDISATANSTANLLDMLYKS